MKPIEVLNKLFEARDAIHFAHLVTTSYAEHQALGEFYSKWLDLADDFLETYQGKYGRINGVLLIQSVSGLDAEKYLKDLRTFVNVEAYTILQKEIDIDLDNILAEMQGLINHTLYKLTLK